jgi:2,4-dienoyl-CoA reductase-like NADH-dependent reductase (Old Yellow Enzyme family)
LLSQWLSGATNRRTDRHGGSLAHRSIFPLMVLGAVREAVGTTFTVIVKMNSDDGCAGGLTLDDAVAFAQAIVASNTTDAVVVSAGMVAKNGFYMLRGAVPLWDMAVAMWHSSVVKAVAVLLFGRWLVPAVPWSECFLMEHALAVQRAIQAATQRPGVTRRVGVILVGGVNSLAACEDALREGFVAVQMARALIREPELVLRMQREAAANAACSQRRPVVASGCTQCNRCVLAALSPTASSRCPLRALDAGVARPLDVEDLPPTTPLRH